MNVRIKYVGIQIYRFTDFESKRTKKGLLTFSCEQDKTFYSLTVQLYAKYVLNFESLNKND